MALMAADASRRWLDDSGIWSCRIKLPQSPPLAPVDASRVPPDQQAHHRFGNTMAPQHPKSMDIPIESVSPSSRRNKGKLAEAIQSMGKMNGGLQLDLPTDPDAQATVTDFLDFTEYLPSDMVRSLTLIGNLDSTYTKASVEVHELTKQYGDLPNLPADGRPDPTKLRADISQNLGEAVSARTASFAEACRMLENVERHYNRIKTIHAKLHSIADAYPSSREASPVLQKSKSPAVSRAPKITLRVGNGGAPDGGARRIRKHRAPRITVPGEVLAPYELDYESYGSESDDSSVDQFVTPRETPALSNNGGAGRIKLKVPKRERPPKPPKENRPAGFGTNVHSQLAGISTSNALRLLAPPPSDAKPGSDHLPWLALSDYELGVLRKKMKKNAVWSPSDTMINRELKLRGRGMEAYKMAVVEAEERGETIAEPPQISGQVVHDKGALSVEAAQTSLKETSPVVNRGMKLNEQKKIKRENQKKELEAAEEGFEEAQRKAGNAKAAMENLFGATAKEDKKSNTKTPSKTPARKRKRDPSEADGEVEKTNGVTTAVKPAARPLLKRSKTETPVPVPQPITAKQSTPALSEATPSVSSEVTSVPSIPSVVTPVPVPAPITAQLPTLLPAPIDVSLETPKASLPAALPSPKKSSTPILPPIKDNKKPLKKEAIRKIEVPTATSERPRRGSAANTPITPSMVITPTSTTAPLIVPVQATASEILPAKRPTSSRSKAASVEREAPLSTSIVERPRRSSTARNTPAPPEARQPSKRTRRPAPGVVQKGSEDSTAVSVGKRSSATRKKAGPKKEKKDGREGSAIFDEIDDEGNIIDPNEPRYCTCNRVSFGVMIKCDRGDCEKEWFHLECVGLTQATTTRRKWYCPDCRLILGLGEEGKGNAGGRKK
ncbi:hypothetical protein HYFRA_00012613 [Hymenoscyphus fraxineus]|uniref:PHD-type domain-containing protein n=1 Tax=Hymenoscyphus fraxineus TaxID=746836 RepID=A0A9N9PXF0_9HELO|nr:hypothetical protein HYFRA_00012613 [Hymenoscyphus fraxineus]